MMPANGPHPLTTEESGRLRDMLRAWGWVDSLSYFATRADRSVVFSRSGKAAVTYRVVGTVTLAAGDPIGDPEAWPGAIDAWLDEARSFGWVPAALGVSERGATAFHRAGFDALELGDEAIIDVARFSLDGRSMRGVRQAVSRCERAGLTVTCHRVADLDDACRAEIRDRATTPGETAPPSAASRWRSVVAWTPTTATQSSCCAATATACSVACSTWSRGGPKGCPWT